MIGADLPNVRRLIPDSATDLHIEIRRFCNSLFPRFRDEEIGRVGHCNLKSCEEREALSMAPSRIEGVQ